MVQTWAFLSFYYPSILRTVVEAQKIIIIAVIRNDVKWWRRNFFNLQWYVVFLSVTRTRDEKFWNSIEKQQIKVEFLFVPREKVLERNLSLRLIFEQNRASQKRGCCFVSFFCSLFESPKWLGFLHFATRCRKREGESVTRVSSKNISTRNHLKFQFPLWKFLVSKFIRSMEKFSVFVF